MVKTQSIRDVGGKEIYDSYMGILRISPNVVDGKSVDDTTTLLKTLKGSDSNDNKIILSDSDGNSLGMYFVPRARKTLVINELGRSETQNVINYIIKSDDTSFVSQSYNIKSTLILDNTQSETTVRPVQIFSDSKTTLNLFNVITYPIESPHTDEYFNNKNTLSLINYSSTVPVNEQLQTSLYNKSLDWYTSRISSVHKVKINGEVVFTTNVNGERVPVLYTHDYVLGNYSGHTAKVTEKIRNSFLGNSIALKQLKNNSSLYSKLSYIRLDELVYERLSKILGGEKRDTRGRYTKLGTSKNYSLTEHLFGTITPNLTSSAPILGTGVPFGGISYNAMPFKRYIFNCFRQELRAKKLRAKLTGQMLDSDLQRILNNGIATEAKQKEEGFSSKMAQNYILCDGKEINATNYPSAYPDNEALYQLNDAGIAKRDSNGLPILTTTNEILNAIQASNKDKKFKSPSLFCFEMSAMRFLRGLNWTSKIGRSTPVDFSNDITSGIYGNNSYNIEILPDSDYGTTKKNLSSVGNYRSMYDFKLINKKHKHYCFSAESGEAICNGTDTMFPNKQLTNEIVDGQFMSVTDGNGFWRDLFTYSFSKNRSTVDEKVQSQTLLYGCQPIRIAGQFAWKVKINGDLENNFESEVQNGSYFINDSALTPVAANKTQRKKQLLYMDKAESVAPVSYIGHSGIIRSCTHRDFKCRPRIRWHHESYDVCQNHGAYQIMRSNGGVKRCVTSLPVSVEETTNKNYNPSTKRTLSFSGGNITMDISLPSPPAFSFLPLMKIS